MDTLWRPTMLLLLRTRVTGDDSWILHTGLVGNYHSKSSITRTRLKTRLHTHTILAQDLPPCHDTAGNHINGGVAWILSFYVIPSKQQILIKSLDLDFFLTYANLCNCVCKKWALLYIAILCENIINNCKITWIVHTYNNYRFYQWHDELTKSDQWV